MCRCFGMPNLPLSPAHANKFHTRLLDLLGSSQNLACFSFFSWSGSFSYSYTSNSDLISGMSV